MIRSMTGYGRGEAISRGKKFTVELKAVNHRYNEIVLRFPRSFSPLEDQIKRLIQSRVARGRIDGFINVEENGEKNHRVNIDKALAAAYYKAMEELRDDLGIDGKIKLKSLVELPGVLLVEEPPEEVEELWPAIQEAVESALHNLVSMREVEGAQLAEDLSNRVIRVAELTRNIRDRSPIVVEEYRERLGSRMCDFIKDGGLDSERLAAEAAIFADRSNITEETVRLDSHLKQVRACLGIDGPVGRKLDFIIQEVNREINTIASKANDLKIGSWVVEVKSELEKIREQVQNIE